MSTVDSAAIISEDPDPSEGSGSRPVRINRRAVLFFGTLIALTVSIGFGFMSWSFRHHGAAIIAPASAATLAPVQPAGKVSPDKTTETQSPENPEASARPSAAPGGVPNPAATPAADPKAALSPEQQAAAAAAVARENSAEAAIGATEVVAQSVPTSGGDASSMPTPAASSSAPTPPGWSSTPPSPTPAPNISQASGDPVSPFAIREADTIDATLIPNTDSSRPGTVTFVVNKWITDSDYGAFNLIPPYTKIIGRVTGIDMSTRAVTIAPNKMLLDNKWIAFPGATLDNDANTGIIGHKNDHRWPVFLMSIAGGALSGLNPTLYGSNASVVVTAQATPPVLQQMAGGAGAAALSQVQSYTQQVPPVTISVARATAVKLQPAADIPLWPYCNEDNPDTKECKALQYLRNTQGGPK